MIDSCSERLVDHQLDRGDIADRHEFLRDRFCRWQKTRTKSGSWDDESSHLHESDDILRTAMPTYVYKFVDTGETIEVQQSFSDDALTEYTHPDSGEVLAVKKVFQPVGVTFKGGGFYKNDSRGGSASKSTSSTASTTSSSTSSSDSSGSSSTTSSSTSSTSSTTSSSSD